MAFIAQIYFSHEGKAVTVGNQIAVHLLVNMIVYLGNFLFIGKSGMATSKARKLKSLSKLAKRDGILVRIRVLVALKCSVPLGHDSISPFPFPGPVNGTGMVCMGQRRWPKPGVDPSGAERTSWALH